MSETDGFIEEVTEEVQRDKLFALMRKYGWIAIAIVILLVGGTAYNEYRKSQVQATAQARGDALLDAMEIEDPEDRAAAIEVIAESEDAGIVEKMLAADGPEAHSLALLQSIADDSELPPRFQDLAKLKLAVLSVDASPQDRIAMLEPLSAAGATYRVVAIEYLVAAHLEAGDKDTAVTIMQNHIEEAETSPAQASRMTEILVGLGVTPDLDSETESAN